MTVDENLEAGWVLNPARGPKRSAVFMVKGTFRLRPGKAAIWADEPEPLSGDVYVDDDPQKALHYPTDFALIKPRADLLLHAVAHAPNQEPSPRFQVRWQVAGFNKSLVVTGDRQWEQGLLRAKPGAPEPFLSLPVSYERAWGGPEVTRNPVGRGRGGSEFPNIESPRAATSGRIEMDPAGFAPLHPFWDQRRTLLGSYDDKWRKTRWPGYPNDFDPAFFNAAPRDQQIDGYLRGDEPMEFENLHPELAAYRTRLPGLRVRCFLEERLPDRKLRFREVPLNLDTLWIDLPAEKLILVWRGQAEIRSVKFKEFEHLFVLSEALTEPPRSLEGYRLLLAERLALADADEEEAETPEPAEDMAVDQAELVEMDKALAQSALDEAAADQLAGAELAGLGYTPSPPAEVPLAQTRVDLAAEVARLQALPLDQQGALPDTKSTLAGVDELAAAEQEMEARLAEGDEAPLTRADVAAAATSKQSLAGKELEELDLSGLDLSGLDLSKARLTKAKLVGAKLAKANLAGADLSEADMTSVILTGAILDGADLSGAIIKDAKLRGLSLANTTLAELNLEKADLSGCFGRGADFAGAKLGSAWFIGAKLPQADFSGCDLAGARFVGADLTGAQFDAVQAKGATFESAILTKLQGGGGSDFSGGNFRQVQAAGSVWEECILDGADFSRANLVGAMMPDASLRQTIFDRANLANAACDDSCLAGAVMTYANLLRVSFERADLTEANLNGANLYEAGLCEAILDHATIRDANLKGTLLG